MEVEMSQFLMGLCLIAGSAHAGQIPAGMRLILKAKTLQTEKAGLVGTVRTDGVPMTDTPIRIAMMVLEAQCTLRHGDSVG